MNPYDSAHKKRLAATLKRINEEINGQNRKLALKYADYLKTECKTSDIRITTLLQRIIDYCKLLKKPLNNTSKEDAKKIVKHAEAQDWSERTKSDYKAMYKQYRKWLTGNEDYPSDVRWIKGKVLFDFRKDKEVLPSDIIGEEDFKKFMLACSNPRDRAMFGLIGELGLRPREVLMLQRKHVDLSNPQYGMLVIPSDTKTGSRNVPCILSKKWLSEWYQKYHPYKDDLEAPLFTQLGRNEKKGLTYNGLQDMFNRIRKRTGLDKKYKRMSLYQFRKYSYTIKAKQGWSDQQLKAFHGLKPKSKAIDTYVKLSPMELIDNVKAMYGLEVRKKKETNIKVIVCPNCRAENAGINTSCEECGLMFSPKEADEIINQNVKLEKELAEVNKKLDTAFETIMGFEMMFKNPETRPKIQEILFSKEGAQ